MSQINVRTGLCLMKLNCSEDIKLHFSMQNWHVLTSALVSAAESFKIGLSYCVQYCTGRIFSGAFFVQMMVI